MELRQDAMAVVYGNSQPRQVAVRSEEFRICKRKWKPLMSFYANIRPEDVAIYQKYMNMVFQVSFHLGADDIGAFLNEVFEKVIEEETIDPLNLEMMMWQYADADPERRRYYRDRWAETVIDPPEDIFFPEPWHIITRLFKK